MTRSPCRHWYGPLTVVHEGNIRWRTIRIDREIKIIKFRGDPAKMSGFVEVRGIVNKDSTMSYGEYTQYDNEFGKS